MQEEVVSEEAQRRWEAVGREEEEKVATGSPPPVSSPQRQVEGEEDLWRRVKEEESESEPEPRSAPTRRRNNHDVWTSEEEEERWRPGRARDSECVWMVGSSVGFQFPVGWPPARLRPRSSAASSNLTASGTGTPKRRKKEKDRPNIPCRFFFAGARGCRKGEVCAYSHNRERYARFRRATLPTA